MGVRASFFVRGGIYPTVVAEHRKRGWKPASPIELPVLDDQSSTRF